MGGINGGTYYSYDYNGAHFIVLNTNDNNNAKNQAVSLEQRNGCEKMWRKLAKMGRTGLFSPIINPYSPKAIIVTRYRRRKCKAELMKLIDELGIDRASRSRPCFIGDEEFKIRRFSGSFRQWSSGQYGKIEENGRTTPLILKALSL